MGLGRTELAFTKTFVYLRKVSRFYYYADLNEHMSHPKPTDKELEILQILWSKGPRTVRQVNDTQN